MKKILHSLKFLVLILVTLSEVNVIAQPLVTPAPYCFPLYSTIPCNQPGPSNSGGNFINDFINSFSTTGGIVNITNNNSGCNAQTFPNVGIRNYFFFGCTQFLSAMPGQLITCTFQSGNVYAQGFTVFVDWNQNGVFNLPGERVCSVPGVPAAASFNNASFTIPATQATGVYRMRVRAAFATSGPTIDPCINYGFGETEDYNLYVNMTPAGVITATASVASPTLCAGQTVSLSAIGSGTAPLTYTWTGPGNYSTTTQNPTLTATSASMSGVYNVTVSPGSCPATGSVNVTVVDYPTYTLTPLTATVCQGGIFTPSVSFGTVLPGTPCSTVGVGPACSSPNVVTLGTGTGVNGLATYPSPYAKWWNDAHQQFLYRATELTAAGVGQGYITSLAFNVTNLNGAGSFPGYTIRIKCTPNMQATSFDMAGLTTVFTAVVNPVNGWNTHNFVTPYYWDGTSNLLVDICFNNGPWSTNVSAPFTNTGFTSCVFNYAIGGGSTCGSTGLIGTSANRPNTRFGNCSTINPNQFNYLWSPGPGIAAPTASTTAITTQPITGTISTAIYSVAVSPNVYSCPNIQTLTVTIVNPLSPSITLVPPMCDTSPLYTMSVTPGGGLWTTNAAINPTTGVITPSLASIGTSTVLYTVGVGSCIATNTAAISVSQFNTANLTGSIVPLCVTSPTQNLMSLVQSTINGSWSGPGITSDIFNPAVAGGGNFVLTYNTVSNPNPTVCPSSSSLTVSVTNTLIPNITFINPICTNASPVTLNVTPNGGTWFGNAGVSPIGILTPSLAPNGSSIVNYSVNVGPCIVTNTADINVSQYNTAAITGVLGDMCNTFSSVNLFSIVQSTLTGVWTGSGVSGNTFNPNLPTGVYTLTYNTVSTPNATLCPDVQTINVSVLNPVQPTITQVGPYCNNAANFQLLVSPATGTWTPTMYNNTTGYFVPAAAAIGINTVQYVIGTNTCNVQDTKTISIEAYVPAIITTTVPDFCNTSPSFNLSLITSNNLGIWSGSGISGTTFNPANSGVGTTLLTYNTSSSPSGLCPAQATIAVNVFSLAIPAMSNVGPYCNTAPPVQIQATPIGGVFGGANNNNVAISPEGIFYPAFASIGNNIINYSVTSGPCIAFAQTIVNIEKFISADLSQYAGPFCKNDAPINLNSIVQNPGGIWTGPGVVGNIFTPSAANIGNSNFITYFTHSLPTASMCPDSSAVRIQVNEIPIVTVVSNNNKGCLPVDVIFNTPSANTGTGVWDLGDGSELKSGLTISHQYTTPGSFTVTFNYQDDIGCAAQATLANAIEVYEVPKASFNYNPEEITIADPEVQLSNLSTILENNTYLWQIGNMFQLDEVNPKIVFPKAGEYEIGLTATTINGCKDFTSKIIQVKNDYGIYIPTSFSPNFDGLNDVFTPVFSPFGLDLKTYQMEIFDRWGHLLFQTKDFTQGWDGSIKNKGEDPLKQEVYVYKIKYKDVEGKIYNKTGHVTLLK